MRAIFTVILMNHLCCITYLSRQEYFCCFTHQNVFSKQLSRVRVVSMGRYSVLSEYAAPQWYCWKGKDFLSLRPTEDGLPIIWQQSFQAGSLWTSNQRNNTSGRCISEKYAPFIFPDRYKLKRFLVNGVINIYNITARYGEMGSLIPFVERP